MKKTVVCIISSFVLIPIIVGWGTPTVSATEPRAVQPGQVIIINQVRGKECCDPGTVQALEQQLESTLTLKLPTHYTVRYDALKNPAFMTPLLKAAQNNPTLVQLGVLIEVTPTLAAAAQVQYTAKSEDWYEAQHVFPLGYSNEDRKKLIDTLMATFIQVTGTQPHVSAGWIMDSSTLRYLHNTYAVAIHQITREQFGVDSYTLVGGPPHYPYPASPEWAFMPKYDQDRPLWIVRQTVTDPLYNYGDTTSSYTSQPNDYARAQRPFEYFVKLVTQALTEQPGQVGFALVGLENSMNTEFQNAYHKQLQFIRQLADTGAATVSFAETAVQQYSQPRVQVYGGSDLTTGNTNARAYFISTPTYRIRLRIEAQKVFISDLRLYSDTFPDYYTTAAGVKHGYWIAPALLDASRSPTTEKETKTFLQRWLGPPTVEQLTSEPHPDTPESTDIVALPDKTDQPVTVKAEPQQVTLSIPTTSGKPYTLSFGMDEITMIDMPAQPQYQAPDREKSPIVYTATKDGFTLGFADVETVATKLQCTDNSTCTVTFQQPSAAAFEELQKSWYPYFLPESKMRPLSAEKTVLYAHNSYALAGRNPVRLVLFPFDEHGFPALHQTITVVSDPPVAYTSVESEGRKSTTQFIDIVHPDPIATTITVTVNDTISKRMTVYFAPNCKENWRYCLKHPVEAWWYLHTVFADKIRSVIFNEKQ